MYEPRDAERTVAGAVMLSGDVYDRCDLRPADFYDARLRTMWAAAGILRSQGVPIDPATLHDQEPSLEYGLLTELMGSVLTVSYVEWHAAIVRRAAFQRAIKRALVAAQASDLEGEEYLANAYRQLDAVRLHRYEDPTVTIGAAVQKAYGELARLEAGEVPGVPTGLVDLERTLGGLPRGALTVVAARPSMGKSSLARVIASGANAAGHGCHVFSPEDTSRAYALRAVADEARVSLEELRLGRIRDRGAMQDIEAASSRLFQRQGWVIDDTAGLSSADVGLRVRRHARMNGTGLVVVDYLQLLREPDVRRGERKQQVDAALEGLLALARLDNLAVLVCSQLSRACEGRDNKRPLLSDLRESGEIEQCADVVLAIYRDEVYHPESQDAGTAEIRILKNKHGRTGTVLMAWDAPSATFRPLHWRTT